MIGEKPASFPFFYIEPAKADNVPLVEKFTGKLTRREVESISPIGKTPCPKEPPVHSRTAQTIFSLFCCMQSLRSVLTGVQGSPLSFARGGW